MGSPNDPLFPFHHTNLDRLNMHWQVDASSRYPDLPSKLWGYPLNKTAWLQAWRGKPSVLDVKHAWMGAGEGCGLHDVISETFPFVALDGSAPKSAGFTHADILDAYSPGGAPYTYDSMQAKMGGHVFV